MHSHTHIKKNAANGWRRRGAHEMMMKWSAMKGEYGENIFIARTKSARGASFVLSLFLGIGATMIEEVKRATHKKGA